MVKNSTVESEEQYDYVSIQTQLRVNNDNPQATFAGRSP